MARLIQSTQRLTLQQQDRLLRRDWPFRTILLGDDLALWRGRVYGLSQGYEVSILYVRRHFQSGFEYAHAWFPEVRILSPSIDRRAEDPDTPIPHVYDELDDPNLCLFDPAFGGWDASQPIAATTVPWIAEWLRFYEAWHATGIWYGGGRDHGGGQSTEASGKGRSGLPQQLHRASAVTGMETSRLILATIEERQAGTLDRRMLADRLRDIDFSRLCNPTNGPVAELLRRAA